MNHYRLYFTNPNFYIADNSVSALIKMLKRLDNQLKVSRGKVPGGHQINFDSIMDQNTVREKLNEFIERMKYENHKIHLEKIGRSEVGISEELNNLISFNNFKIIE